MNEQQLNLQIDQFILDNRDAIVRDIAALVAIDSVKSPGEQGTTGAPFGPGPRMVLDTALKMAQNMGLETNDGNGYVGWAQLPGTGPRHIATITHLDTVPAGDGWDGTALELRQRDGWLIGRGVQDDKGPSVLCLYLAKFFLQLGEPLPYGLRVLLGCDEETGMSDVDYYLERRPQPLFCFSPDSTFPLANGEKGIMEGDFYSAPLKGSLVAFEGGLASNAVPDRAACVVRTETSLKSTGHITVTPQPGGLVQLKATGVAGHAAHPQNTLNAIGLLVNHLLDNHLCTGEEEHYLQLLRLLHQSTDGTGLGIDCRDDRFDPLTCIGGVIELRDGVLRQNINIRYPTATTGQKLTQQLAALAAQHGATYRTAHQAEPFYIPADSSPIQALLDAYRDVTGSAAPPFTMGGGTYARHFKNAVSYGPAEENTPYPDFAGPEHGANEGIRLEQLLRAFRIYVLAVYRLQQLDL